MRVIYNVIFQSITKILEKKKKKKELELKPFGLEALFRVKTEIFITINGKATAFMFLDDSREKRERI